MSAQLGNYRGGEIGSTFPSGPMKTILLASPNATQSCHFRYACQNSFGTLPEYTTREPMAISQLQWRGSNSLDPTGKIPSPLMLSMANMPLSLRVSIQSNPWSP